MKPPSERARLVLERYKAAAALPGDDKARLASLLHERAARGDLPRFDVRPGTPQVPHGTLAHQLWGSAVTKLSVAILAIGAASGGAYLLQKDAHPGTLSAPSTTLTATPPEARPLALPAPTSLVVPLATAPLSLEARLPTEHAPRKPERAGEAVPASTSASATSSEPTIDEEVKLVSGAQTALRAGNAQRALQLLNEDAARFPSGKLTPLRQVTHMMALCQAGQAERARQEAANFLAKAPDSPFAARVRGICASAPASP